MDKKLATITSEKEHYSKYGAKHVTQGRASEYRPESSPRERPESRKSRGTKKQRASEKYAPGSINYINSVNNNVIIVQGGGVVRGPIAPVFKKPKIGRTNYNDSSSQLNRRYMEELLSREKKAFEDQITSLKQQHEKMQEDIYKQQQHAMKDRQMRQKASKHSKSHNPGSKERQPKGAQAQSQFKSYFDHYKADLENQSQQELAYATQGAPSIVTSSSNGNVAPYYGQNPNTKIIQDARRAIQGSIYG